MCTSIGVDPLSSQRTLLSSVLHLGDFYYTLALHVAEACMVTQPYNGGLISMPELLQRVTRKVSGGVSPQDVVTAVDKLRCLGGGWQVLDTGGGGMVVRSVPSELSVDEVDVLRWASGRGGEWTVRAMVDGLRWDRRRVEDVTRRLIGSGMAWVDAGGRPPDDEEHYFFYSLFIEQCASVASSADDTDEKNGSAAPQPRGVG